MLMYGVTYCVLTTRFEIHSKRSILLIEVLKILLFKDKTKNIEHPYLLLSEGILCIGHQPFDDCNLERKEEDVPQEEEIL